MSRAVAFCINCHVYYISIITRTALAAAHGARRTASRAHDCVGPHVYWRRSLGNGARGPFAADDERLNA